MISKFATQDELEKDEHDINWNSLIQNDPYKQYADYTEIKKNNPQHKISHETYYSCEELENISLCDIDLSKIKPTYEDVLNGKYNIKHKILNQEICGTNLPHFVGLLTDSESFSIDEFEKEVQRCGNKPENLYRYWYTINKLYFDELYKRHIIELQEVENNKIKKDSTSIAKATKDVPIDEINIASNLLDEITNEISKKGETRNEPDN